jgi:hypothetical protein
MAMVKGVKRKMQLKINSLFMVFGGFSMSHQLFETRMRA